VLCNYMLKQLEKLDANMRVNELMKDMTVATYDFLRAVSLTRN
jgi:hypothetical protein